jgi:hypothetical protein
MRLRHVAWFLLTLALVAGRTASAAPQTYGVNGTIPSLGSAHVASYSIFGNDKSAYAVGFDATLDGVHGVSFCGDLLHSISLNSSYDAVAQDLGSLDAGYTAAAKMAQRWSFDLGSLGSSLADAAAGTQLAIWETIYGANFTITGALSAGTQAAYDTVLGTDYSNLGVGNTVFLDVNGGRTAKQDHFFTPGGPAAPEPGAAFLFSAGLVIVSHVLRRSTV